MHPGTPDVNYLHGWVELKWLREWPKRARTVVKIDHFTTEQKVWLDRRWMNGGSAHLLLQCKREWLLFNGDDAAYGVGRMNRQDLLNLAHKYSNEGMEKRILETWLPRD